MVDIQRSCGRRRNRMRKVPMKESTIRQIAVGEKPKWKPRKSLHRPDRSPRRSTLANGRHQTLKIYQLATKETSCWFLVLPSGKIARLDYLSPSTYTFFSIYPLPDWFMIGENFAEHSGICAVLQKLLQIAILK